jgi:hypothetical protein
LFRTLHAAELAGLDPAEVVRTAVTSRDLAGARDIAAVLGDTECEQLYSGLPRCVPVRGPGRIEPSRSWLGSGPAGEDAKCLVGGRTRFGAVDDDGLPRVGRDLQGVVLEVEVAGQGMAERLDAAAVVLDVVRSPQLPEGLAAQGQLADQAGQGPVVRGASGLGAQAADGGVGDAVPVPVEPRGYR